MIWPSLELKTTYLKELNLELKEKSDLSKEVINGKSYKNDSNIISYADIAKSDKANTRKIIPNVLIKAINKNNLDALNQVKRQLLGDITVTVKKLLTNKTGDVSTKCKNKEDVDRAKTLLSNKLKDGYQVEVQSLKAPRFKMLDVQNDLSLDDLMRTSRTETQRC
ncbi:hypothetical protein EVAR_76430_1 [Eumeta japonica]|uniref:Uncharacterized protein n=1 Tax=Eumeta variegata TaxID=151549 RepID=A0A4C1T865_EUMVA|nr:hypothetical protein EVAR_76430_1 [Eumeta japonica]